MLRFIMSSYIIFVGQFSRIDILVLRYEYSLQSETNLWSRWGDKCIARRLSWMGTMKPNAHVLRITFHTLLMYAVRQFNEPMP